MPKRKITLKTTLALTSPWSDMIPVMLGDGDVREFLLVEEEGAPGVRFDLCWAGPECWLKTEAIWWRDRVVVGFGERVYVVDPLSRAPRCTKLREYFQGLYWGDDWLLVASGTNIVRLDCTGKIVWCSGPLGRDGVVIHEVCDDTISGDGEWNPPNGWIPFRISLRDGSVVS